MDNQKAIWDERYQRADHSDQNMSWIARYDPYFAEMAGEIIVDLGCGTGENAAYLADKGFDVVACDFSLEALNRLRAAWPTMDTRAFDMTRGLPFERSSVGVVLASLSTHYFPLAETIALYKEIHRVLRPGGYFILRVNGVKEKEEEDAERVVEELEENYFRLKNGCVKRYFTEESLRALLMDFAILSINDRAEHTYRSIKYFIECAARRE